MHFDLKHPSLPVVAISCIGLIMALSLTSLHGAGVSTDAVNYLSAAENLASGNGYTNFEGDFYVLWPPLYPTMLAVAAVVLRVDPLVFASALNGVAFAGIILLMGLLAGKVLDSDWFLGSLASAATLLSASNFSVSVNIGTDPVFIIFLLSFFLLFERYARLTDRSSLAGMIVVGGLACLQRYIGAALILTGFLGILYVRREKRRRALTEASTFGALSILPMIIWMARNYSVSGTLLGVRDPHTWSPDQNLQDILFKASRWFIPYQLSSRILFWAALAAVLLILLALNYRRRATAIATGSLRPTTLVLILFSVIYLSAMVVLTKSVDHKNISYDDRLYLPAFFSLLLLALLFIRRAVFPLLKGRFAAIGRTAVIGACLVWLLFPANGLYKFWVRCVNDKGIAYYNIYNKPAYRDSAVTLHLEPWTTDPSTPVFSNYPAAVYLSTRRIVGSLPSRTDFFGAATPLEGFAGKWPGDSPAILVWYLPNTKRNLYSIPELASLARFEPVFTSMDGAIYQIEAR